MHSGWTLWPDEDNGPWLVETFWAVVRGRAECVGVELRSFRRDGEEGDWAGRLPPITETQKVLTASLLRKLPIGRLIDATRDQETWMADFLDPSQRDEQWSRDRAAWRGELEDDESPHAEVARVYLEALRIGRKPTRAVQRHFTITYSAAAKRVARAREAGYLPETTKGRLPDAEPTTEGTR